MLHLGEFGKYDKIVTVSKIGIKYIILYFLRNCFQKVLGTARNCPAIHPKPKFHPQKKAEPVMALPFCLDGRKTNLFVRRDAHSVSTM